MPNILTRMPLFAPPAPLAWTGERMVPNASDLLTEAFHWQRYAFFRPWYVGAKVVDAASGEGYGMGYAALFALDALGLDIDSTTVDHAASRYPRARFETTDIAHFDYSDADLVVSFGAIEHVSDPRAFLAALDHCKGAIVVSASTGMNEFVESIRETFGHRQIRFLSQENRWPGVIREGLDLGAHATIAVIDGGVLPAWPRLGLAMPCCGEAEAAATATTRITMHYPGEVEIALVAQGCDEKALERLRAECAAAPHAVHLIERPKNVGYGQGANVGLAFLKEKGFDLYGVSHDDVVPAPDCIPQLVAAALAIRAAGHDVGMIGPVSNEATGDQLAEIGNYKTVSEMHDRALAWGTERHSHVDCVLQVSGLFFLMTPECLDSVGGFDPLFGLGNFQDDDINLRVRLSGHPLWIAPGAFLHHVGASSFKRLELDFEDGEIRNLALFLEKWDAEKVGEAIARTTMPDGVQAHVPFDAKPPRSAHFITINGAPVDLVHQASEFDLASWIVTVLRDKPREARIAVLDALESIA